MTSSLSLEKFYTKLQTETDLRRHKGMALADEVYFSENQECTFTPALNPASRNMAGSVDRLERRYKSELEKKAKRIEEGIRQKEEKENLLIHPAKGPEKPPL